MGRLPDDVLDVFEEHTSADSIRRTNYDSVELRPLEDNIAVDVEFTRHVGEELLSLGYAIVGIRHHEDSYLEVWVDDVSDRVREPTVAERAAEIVRRDTAAEIVANDSDEPKEQYIDVFPDPHEQSSEDWSLKPQTVEQLRDEGIRLRGFSGGRERSRFNDENYRVWFTTTE